MLRWIDVIKFMAQGNPQPDRVVEKLPSAPQNRITTPAAMGSSIAKPPSGQGLAKLRQSFAPLLKKHPA